MLAGAADRALGALRALAPEGAFDDLSGAGMLCERASITGRWPRGTVSAGGTCRLLEAADGWLALNLARDADWGLVPAWLEDEGLRDWIRIERAVRERPVAELVARGRTMGLAVAPEHDDVVGAPHGRDRLLSDLSQIPVAPMGRSYGGAVPLVVDLSALWAGPLCGHLLQRLGARAIKVESTQRPDGARQGPSTFFDLLNAGKASVALDLATPAGRAQLAALLRRADIVIESSRPRALRQMGIDADALAREHGVTWVSITGYGRGDPERDWVAYGDDAAVAAGLTRRAYEATGVRRIVGDAVADPLTGLHAAGAAWRAWSAGGARVVSLSLCGVVRTCLEEPTLACAGPVPRPGALRLRRPTGIARPLGADTSAVLAEFGA